MKYFGLYLSVIASIILVFSTCKKEPEIPNINMYDYDVGVENNLYCIWFVNEELGYAGGEDGLLLKTEDSGYSWEVEFNSDTIQEDITGIYFSNNNGIIEYRNYYVNTHEPYKGSGNYLFTYNKGLTWTHCDSLELSDSLLFQLTLQQYKTAYPHLGSYYVNTNKGFKVMDQGGNNYQGKVYIYENGDLYQQVSSGVEYNLYAIHFIDEYNGFAVGRNSLLRSKNGGLVWDWLRNQNGINIQKNLFGVFMLTSSSGYVVGENGTIIKFTE